LESSFEYGKRLTQAREKMGITLEEVSYELKINLGTLRKLEASDTKGLPKPAFTKGFIKAYAKFLKVSPTLIMDEYVQTLDAEKMKVSGSVLVETSEPKEFFIVDFLKDKLFPMVLFVSVIAAVFILYTFLGSFENSHVTEVTQVEQDTDTMIDVTPAPEAVVDKDDVDDEEIDFSVFDEDNNDNQETSEKKLDTKAESIVVKNEAAEEAIEKEEDEKPKYVPPSGKHRLVVEPLAKTYLYIKTSKDNRPIRATLVPDKVRSFRFDQAEIRFVDAGAVNVIFDGEDLGALGVFGQEKKLDFPSLKEL